MTILVTIIFLAVFLGLMGIGLLFKNKVLRRGCSLGPDCHCKNEPQKSTTDDCEHSTK